VPVDEPKGHYKEGFKEVKREEKRPIEHFEPKVVGIAPSMAKEDLMAQQ